MKFASVIQTIGNKGDEKETWETWILVNHGEASIINDALSEYCQNHKGKKKAKNLQVEFEFHIPCGWIR